MPRYKLIVEYDGTDFQGWQKHATAPTVQKALEAAAQQFCSHPCETVAAGRTDSGVHARGQVVHLDFAEERSPYSIMQGINFHLGEQRISVVSAQKVSDHFHARFDATFRRYRYRILPRSARPSIDLNRVWHHPKPLNISAMQEATQVLLGHHDFTSFRDTQCQAKSPIKTLEMLYFEQVEEEIHVHTKARSFLHHQVRIMVGSLAKVGVGDWTIEDLKTALEAKSRCAAGPTAPAQGLYLEEVGYEASDSFSD